MVNVSSINVDVSFIESSVEDTQIRKNFKGGQNEAQLSQAAVQGLVSVLDFMVIRCTG